MLIIFSISYEAEVHVLIRRGGEGPRVVVYIGYKITICATRERN